nr:nucleotidyltransferase family protein [Candidatus Sigynarchaeum springense]
MRTKDAKAKSIGEIKARIIPILTSYNVAKAGLFGSVVRDDFTAKSDVDILVEFNDRKSLLEIIGLQQEIEDQIGRNVDMLTFGSLHRLLKDKILAEQVLIFP